MTCAAYADPTEIVRRCTRDGHTAWQAVAMQLGRSVDSVRSQFDPAYLNARPWTQLCEPMEPEQDPKPTMAQRITGRLTKGPADALTVALYITANPQSVRVFLSQMAKAGLVERDRFQRPCVWRLKEQAR